MAGDRKQEKLMAAGMVEVPSDGLVGLKRHHRRATAMMVSGFAKYLIFKEKIKENRDFPMMVSDGPFSDIFVLVRQGQN